MALIRKARVVRDHALVRLRKRSVKDVEKRRADSRGVVIVRATVLEYHKRKDRESLTRRV